MIEKLKNLFRKPEPEPVPEPTPAVEKEPAPKRERKPKKTAKELATENNEPYVSILSVELDPNNIGNGAFELDWNDKFVANLVRAGYQGKTDQQIVDQWFQDVCRNILLENYEQEQADPERRQMNRRRLDNDRTEFS